MEGNENGHYLIPKEFSLDKIIELFIKLTLLYSKVYNNSSRDIFFAYITLMW